MIAIQPASPAISARAIASTALSLAFEAASTVNGPTFARVGRTTPTSTRIAGAVISGAAACTSVVADCVIAARFA